MRIIERFFYLCLMPVFVTALTQPLAAQNKPGALVPAAELEAFARSAAWLKFFQVKKSGKSPIESPYFFISDTGSADLLAELKAELAEFSNPKSTRTFGLQKSVAACAYPARKQLIEQYLKIELPSPACPDLKYWLERMHANRASIVFAGPYGGNPASVLGHTFLRLYSDERIGARHDLLSYAVGFLANSTPGDSRALYMVRGLTGQYPGHFEIEPLYVKIGLYNNSESRDLWEQSLNLTSDEVNFLELYLWELNFNSIIPYYFADENCSYRLLSLVEAVRPQLNLIAKLSPVVLPADTVRVLISEKVAENAPRYRASVLRKIDMRVQGMSAAQTKQFVELQNDVGAIGVANDAVVLDALMDYWSYRNYRAEINLTAAENDILEATYTRRSALAAISTPINDSEIKDHFGLSPTYVGHHTSSVELRAGRDGQSKVGTEELRYRMGTHSLVDAPGGYDGVGQIEYLGFDILKANQSGGEKQSGLYGSIAPSEVTMWRALLVEAKSIEPLQSIDFKPSWSAHVDFEGRGPQSGLNLSGGFGSGFDLISSRESLQKRVLPISVARAFLLPTVATHIAVASAREHQLALGLDSGLYIQSARISAKVEFEPLWSLAEFTSDVLIEGSYHFRADNDLKVIFSNHLTQIGYKLFF